MQIFFIRHAQSENNALYDLTGTSDGRNIDPKLTPLGEKQAELLAGYLRQHRSEFPFTHLYCSLMVRAVATAVFVARELNLPLVAWVDLHEEGGIYLRDDATGELIGQPGNGRSFFREHYPEVILPETLDESGWWNRPFEPTAERELRARRFLEELRKRHGRKQDNVALISHGGFYNLVMAELLKPEKKGNIWFSLNNTAISRLEINENQTNIRFQNRVSWMPQEMIT